MLVTLLVQINIFLLAFYARVEKIAVAGLFHFTVYRTGFFLFTYCVGVISAMRKTQAENRLILESNLTESRLKNFHVCEFLTLLCCWFTLDWSSSDDKCELMT